MFYEVDESIDAVDFVIEHKNELLCGRSGLELKDKDALKVFSNSFIYILGKKHRHTCYSFCNLRTL